MTIQKTAYHHGDLRQALIEAGQDLLQERGVDGFSLREVARRIGVSPSAPAHHFGDTRGLLTAIATRAFKELGQRLESADAAALLSDGPIEKRKHNRLKAQGRAYVDFAMARPSYFDLMWRCGVLDKNDPELQMAGEASFLVLRRAIEGDLVDVNEPISPEVIGAWSMVHGFARLSLDGAFAHKPEISLAMILETLPH
jgi:AcrR family transcriptional regulator